MIKTKTIKVDRESIIGITCNKCGKDCTNNCVTICVNWGFGSMKDCESHLSHICEDCYDKFIKTFKIPVTIKEYQ